MTTFYYDETVPNRDGAVRSTALGASNAVSARFTDKDLNKAVKLGADSTYVLAEDGNDLEAVVVAMAPHTVNDGYSFGSVQRYFVHKRAIVSGNTLAVGAQVVCAAQNALGTPQEYPIVKAGNGTLFKWRVVSLLGGNGSAGTVVVLEPINQ